jgi:hypothetical protein
LRRPNGTEITARESRRLATGLVVYGVVGIVLAIAMIVAVFVLRGSFSDVQDDVSGQIDRLEVTIGKTSVSLTSTADSLDGFTATFDRTSSGLGQISDVVDNLAGVITDLGRIFDAIRPLIGSVPALGEVAEELRDLVPTLAAVTESLDRNEPQLATTADSLRVLAAQLDDIQQSLASGDIVTRVGQGFDFLRVAIIALAVWFAVPAAAALYIGISLRRAVRPTEAPA